MALVDRVRKPTYGKAAAELLVRKIGQPKQRNSGTKHTQPAEAENDPKQHGLYRFHPALLGWSQRGAVLWTSPPFITKSIFCNSEISAMGSPFTATRSAYLPVVMLPTSFCIPSSSAALVVAERMA